MYVTLCLLRLLSKKGEDRSFIPIVILPILSIINRFLEFKKFIEEDYFAHGVANVTTTRVSLIDAGDHAIEVSYYTSYGHDGDVMVKGK